MLRFKCKSCGFVVSEQELVALTKQVLGGGELSGSFKYGTCLKCGSHNIESTEDTFSSYAEEHPRGRFIQQRDFNSAKNYTH